MLESKEILMHDVRSLKDYILLVAVDAKGYQKATTEILRELIEDQRIPGVYVTLNKPYEIIQRNLASEGIDSRLIIFIDAASGTGETKKVDNCLCIGSPEKLSDISVAMEQAIKALNTEEKFLVFDSINTLLLFNKPATIARFVHFLAAKIREWKIKGIIITLEGETEKSLMSELTLFSDSRIDIGGEP